MPIVLLPADVNGDRLYVNILDLTVDYGSGVSRFGIVPVQGGRESSE